jgi:hypothetical protein
VSVRIKDASARHRSNDPGCFKSVALGSALAALLLSAITRTITRRSR